MMLKIFIGIILILTSVVTSVIYHKTQQADINFYQGQLYFKKGEFEKAIPYYEKSLSIKPSQQKAIRGLAYCYQWTNRHKQAIEFFEKLSGKKPKDYKVKKDLADTLSWQGKYAEAIVLYKEVIKNTGDIEAIKSLARVYAWDRQYTLAEELLEKIINKDPDDLQLKLLAAEIRLYIGDYQQARKILEEIIKKDHDNIQAKIYIADILTYVNNLDAAIALYRQMLNIKYDRSLKEKLADTLSWDRQYSEALKLYDELLNEKDAPKIRRQKARVLGWMRRYNLALKEYSILLGRNYDPLIALEKKAKGAYWNSRVKEAIRNYKEIIEKEPQNLEAMFDLAQIYSYQLMCKEAITEYNKILALSPKHFRAQEGKEKINLISKHVHLNTSYEFYEADSSNRDTDIKRHSLKEQLIVPFSDSLSAIIDYQLTRRDFADLPDITENNPNFKLAYINNPSWKAEVFYGLHSYNKDINTLHVFGSDVSVRVFDRGEYTLSLERKQLEDNSTVIRGRCYSDDYKQRIGLDINNYFKIAADYLYAHYSDSNYKNEPGLDLLYFFSLDPRRLSLKYRYFWRNFKNKTSPYFSPKGFSTNALTLNWRHYLNKEEIFFGADDIYYELGYEIAVDSRNVVGHKFSVQFNRDINKRLNFNIKGAYVNSSASVYTDKDIVVSLNYYF